MIRKSIIIPSLFFFVLAKGQLTERSFYGGIMYKSSGLGVVYQNKFEAAKGFGKQFDIEFATYHHPQETKTFNKEVNNPTPFVFGKLNKTAILKMNYCLSHKITDFSDAQRIGIDVVFGGGVALGFLKPVYINLIYPDAFGYEKLIAEKYNPAIHTDKTRIAGYSDNRIGWNELEYKTGISITGGIGFTWGYYTNFPKRLEAGFYMEYFNKGLPVMAFAKNKSVREGVYLKLFLGKRTSKN